MEQFDKRCSQCDFYRCNIHSLPINEISQEFLKCFCSFMDYIWKIKNKTVFKIFVELILQYIDNEKINNYKVDQIIDKLIINVFKNDVILINDEITPDISEIPNTVSTNNKRNSNIINNRKFLSLQEKKDNKEHMTENYFTFKIFRLWLKENLNRISIKKLNYILNKINWYLDCFIFNSNEELLNELNELNPLSYETLYLKINNLFIKFKHEQIKLKKILNEIEMNLNLIKFSTETYSKVVYTLGAYYMHIFFQWNNKPSNKLIKFLNIFDFFTLDFLSKLKLYNKKWIESKLVSENNSSYTHNSNSKRLKFKNENNNDYLIHLKDILFDENIESILNLTTAKKLLLLYNYLLYLFEHKNPDINDINDRYLIQYILFIYIKIICFMLDKENQKDSLIIYQKLLQDISNNIFFSSKVIINNYNHNNKNKLLINQKQILNDNAKIISTSLRLFPYKNIIIIPTISNYYNIYILLFKKICNISFDQLENFEKQLITLKDIGIIFYDGWLLLSYAYYKLFSFKKSKKILKYCQKVLHYQKQQSLENNDINNYEINYFDSFIFMLQGCCYYNMKKYDNSIIKFKICIENNNFYEQSLWNLYLIYKQQNNIDTQMEILFILIQLIYQKDNLSSDIPINLIFLRMFQLLCENQSEEEILDFINNLCIKKDILFKFESEKKNKNKNNNENDICILSLFRIILRYLIDHKNIDKALEVFLIIKNKEPLDIVGIIYYSEILIYHQNNFKILLKGINILENIKDYISFINIFSNHYSNSNDNNNISLEEENKTIFSNELMKLLSDQNEDNKRKKGKNRIEIKDEDENNKFNIPVGFEQKNIQNHFKFIYQYMKSNQTTFDNFCNNTSNQNHILSIIHWNLSYGYYLTGNLNLAYSSSKNAYILEPNNINITYNYCILSLKLYGFNVHDKIAYEWKECRRNNYNNKDIKTSNEIKTV
ncbi:hypothetical protein BCR32DRAFT_293216 [Anaeromyces robustus]|uniref:Uncharacterized protein n=1 Tax=Anaeromyces robustus TaxID=1754192 RepID=A0A1Y1X708_9FUNG|nr:hypothetical protein BCR32DRAFT_293216 [Anaeromyces robustus]|eukprot:ORX81541.1 hypothetical protein BCR32DRAFT_293216 [Anaeromyces robustus]